LCRSIFQFDTAETVTHFASFYQPGYSELNSRGRKHPKVFDMTFDSSESVEREYACMLKHSLMAKPKIFNVELWEVKERRLKPEPLPTT
jgi:hypothetical protein